MKIVDVNNEEYEILPIPLFTLLVLKPYFRLSHASLPGDIVKLYAIIKQPRVWFWKYIMEIKPGTFVGTAIMPGKHTITNNDMQVLEFFDYTEELNNIKI